MSYDSTVLADNPILYWKLEDPPGSTTLAEEVDGDDAAAEADTTFQIAGPIETDSPTYGIFGGGGYLLPVPSGKDPTAAVTYEGWGYMDSGDTATLVGRNEQLLDGNILDMQGGRVRCTVKFSAVGGDYSLQSAVLPDGYWYHCVMTRSGGVLRLYVNGALAAERTDLPGGALYVSSGVLGWAIGISPANPNLKNNGVSHVAIYDTALSAARVLAHYEAARPPTAISATVTVRCAVSLDTDSVQPTDFPFSHNWAVPIGGQPARVKETLMYNTWSGRSQPDYQQRVNQYPHAPEREIEYQITVNTPNQRARLQAAFWTPGQIYKVPIWTDWTVLTAQATAGDSSLSLDTTKRDFEVGSYVGICSDTYDPRTYQFFQITSRTDSSLGITPNVGSTVANGSPVFPARMMGLEDDSLGVTSHTRDRETFALKFKVLPTELSTRRLTAYTPAETYKSVEIFDQVPVTVEWLDEKGYQITRRQEGSGDRLSAVDTGSPRTIPVRVLLTTREELSAFLGWLDYHQGKQVPVWIETMEHDFQALSAAVNKLKFTAFGYPAKYNLHHARRDVRITYADGATTEHRLLSPVDNGDGTEECNLTPFRDGGTIARVSFLRYCTLSSDIFEIIYTRNGSGFIAEAVFSFQELLTSPA